MNKTEKYLKQLSRMQQLKLILIAIAIIAVIGFLFRMGATIKNSHLELEADTYIDVTPQVVTAIRDIGQWEFLSINDEQLVDTTRKGLFTDDHLSRIYYGTVRLGIDLSLLDEESITARGDSIDVQLPPVQLLDENFIDEARTKSFYESGKWTPRDREAMYQRAKRQMLTHCLTPKNIQTAQQNAEAQLRRMFRTMGYNNVALQWSE